MKFKMFLDSNSLVNYAEKFLKERLDSLWSDVNKCLSSGCAFPALLYCFSVVDLMGALSCGYATDGSHSRGNFKEYMIKFMKNGSTTPRERYTNEQADLLLEIYRHKIVHLAQPKLVVEKDSRLIGWRFEISSTSHHLALECGPKTLIRTILTPKQIYYDHVFVISISQLACDIIESVNESKGYLQKLRSGYKSMQAHFDDAVYQIYDIHPSGVESE
jgi:hypothetical protein